MSVHTLAPGLTEPPTRDALRITGVELVPVSSPLKHAFTMREETLRSIDSVLIKLHTDAGIVGIADTGNVSPWYLGETQEPIMTMIATVLFPEVLRDEAATNIERIVARMDFLCRENSQAKALVDYALHDIKGRLYGVPVYELLGGRSVDRVKLAWVTNVMDALNHLSVSTGIIPPLNFATNGAIKAMPRMFTTNVNFFQVQNGKLVALTHKLYDTAPALNAYPKG